MKLFFGRIEHYKDQNKLPHEGQTIEREQIRMELWLN